MSYNTWHDTETGTDDWFQNWYYTNTPHKQNFYGRSTKMWILISMSDTHNVQHIMSKQDTGCNMDFEMTNTDTNVAEVNYMI